MVISFQFQVGPIAKTQFLLGYEIMGIENIPPGGALLVYYHGAVPIDFYYICSHILLYEGRLINPVGDRFLFKIPGKIIRSCFAVLYFLKNAF